jgi:signal transduction histidine kinase
MLTTHKPSGRALLAAPQVTRAWRPRWRAWLGASTRWLAAWALAWAVALLLCVLLLHPSASDLMDLAIYFLAGGAASVLVGAAALWLTAAGPLAGVRVKFAVPAVLTALIISFNVLLVGQLMFISGSDSLLVLDILIFSVVVAVALSTSVSGTMASAIRRIEAGARRVAGGEYNFRLPRGDLGGSSELAQLGEWFNQMAASVEDAFARQQRAERERRQVIAALSHDLRTPLASIRALIEAITDGVVSDPAMVARYQQTISAQSRHLSVLIDDLFELARLEASTPDQPGLHLELVAPDDLISDTLEAMRAQADRRGVCLSGQVTGELPPVRVDVRRVHRLLANLVQNSLAHTPPGGRVAIRAAVRHEAGGARAVLVQVLDSGEGIAAHDLPHIFEPMYRGEASRRRATTNCEPGERAGQESGPLPESGAGLGLAIARRLVEAHGGQIWAESPLAPETTVLLCASDPEQTVCAAQPYAKERHTACGPGTCVSFTLPLQRSSAP